MKVKFTLIEGNSDTDVPADCEIELVPKVGDGAPGGPTPSGKGTKANGIRFLTYPERGN